jgi:hypothetical protein
MLIVWIILMTLAVIACAVSIDVLGDVLAEKRAVQAAKLAMAPKWSSSVIVISQVLARPIHHSHRRVL